MMNSFGCISKNKSLIFSTAIATFAAEHHINTYAAAAARKDVLPHHRICSFFVIWRTCSGRSRIFFDVVVYR